jgi:hypothetical protein
LFRACIAAGVVGLTGCPRLRIDPVQVQVQPIQVEVDVNVRVEKVDRALSNFFEDAYGGTGGNSQEQTVRDPETSGGAKERQ